MPPGFFFFGGLCFYTGVDKLVGVVPAKNFRVGMFAGTGVLGAQTFLSRP